MSDDPEHGKAVQLGPETSHGLETLSAAIKEDRLRLRRVRRVLNRRGTTRWVNLADRIWLAKQRPRNLALPTLNRNDIQRLAQKLKSGLTGGIPGRFLASSVGMRTIRVGLDQALHGPSRSFLMMR